MDQSATMCEPGPTALTPAPQAVLPTEVDRRHARRCPAVTVDAWLAWEVAPVAGGATSPALLLDFSERGALVAVDELPPAGAKLWLGLDRPVRPEGVEVIQVDSTRTKIGPHLLRVRFALICPPPIYSSVVLGITAATDREIDRRLDRA